MKKLLLLFIILITSITSSYASHLISADITYTHVSGNDYEVTLDLYLNCSGTPNPPPIQNINFNSTSCGQSFAFNIPHLQSVEVSQVCAGQLTTCNGGTVPGIERLRYRGIVTLTPCSDWNINWNSCCRNPAITNLLTPAASSFYTQTRLNNVVGSGNNSPQFFNAPIAYLNNNNLTIYNHGAYDVDGDSLSYSLASPLTTPGPPGVPLAFMPGYSQNQPIISSNGFNLDPFTGDMCFTPSQVQLAYASTLIEEYRNGVLIGSQIRELFVIVNGLPNPNQAPNQGFTPWCGQTGSSFILPSGPSVTQTDSNSIEMCPNDNVCFEIYPSDPNGDNVNVSSNISITIPGATLTVVNNNTPNPIVTVCWTPTGADQGLNSFYINLTDDACPMTLNRLFAYDIRVFAGVSAGVDQVICAAQSAQLNASGGTTYTWYDAATNIQVPVGPAFSCNPCSNPIATPNVTTNYYVLSSMVTCGNTDSVLVTVAPNFTADVIGDTVLCNLGSAPLAVNILTGPIGTYTYLWNNAATLNNYNIQNPVASPTTSTWYTPTITSPQGCTKIVDSAYVEISQMIITNQNQFICQGDSILIAGIYQNTAGTYYDTLPAIIGCDTIASTTLALLSFTPSFTVTDNGLGNYSFTNTSTGNYTLSDWNFGDGTTSSMASPNHTFAVNGTFVVVLAIADASVLTNTSCIEYYMDTITVTTAANILPCNAGFVVYPDAANTNITIFNSSIGNTLTYLWDFGDGTTSTLQNPTHAYTGAGPYYLCVTINDGAGCIDTFCDSVSATGVAFKGAGGFTINVTSTPLSTDIEKTIAREDFSIQPNPNNGIFTINKIDGFNKEVKIKIFDISSRIISEVTIPAGKEKIDINIQDYRKGIYFVQLTTDNTTSIKRIIKR